MKIGSIEISELKHKIMQYIFHNLLLKKGRKISPFLISYDKRFFTSLTPTESMAKSALSTCPSSSSTFSHRST